MWLWIVLAAVLCGILLCGWYLNRILNQPETLFNNDASVEQAIPEQTMLAPAFPVPDMVYQDGETIILPEAISGKNAEVAPSESDSAADGTSRINIMLMGIDAYESGQTTSGTMPHTDVMMVIAVNFDQDTVDLITLPRDTLTTAPGHYGFYKLNGVFNVGLNGRFSTTGKADDLSDGFLLACRAAEQWLGGISIPYYYAVDFQAVIDIVDAIGGIDYDVDQTFRSMSGRKIYHEGMQHLDGDAVLGYLRIRNEADGLDSSRTARQRHMLLAIFNKLKTEGSLSQVPALIAAANSGIYTNTSLAQTTALADYARGLASDRIRTHSMYGEIGTIEYEWRFAYVDQQNRIDLIQEIFGIKADPVGTCTRQYERWLHNTGFYTMKYLRQLEKLLTEVQQRKAAGESFTDDQIALYTECYSAYVTLYCSFDTASQTLAEKYGVTPWREKSGSRSGWTATEKAEDKELSSLEKSIQNQLKEQRDQARKAAAALAESIRYRSLSWTIPDRWYQDTDINEVTVHFG